ncbi:hypothetical protein PR048_007255 [Dryococelus australis]|uniref:Uncharacterized protein n=1 Tax=Dryococelus australis TaxID=614101 RepID=A0ABQ9IE27_9NEOP|nr:hypothetical protein PR048_007255 [Dryococelus australis]
MQVLSSVGDHLEDSSTPTSRGAVGWRAARFEAREALGSNSGRGMGVKLRQNLHASHKGSIPGRVIPGFSHVGIEPDDAAGWRVFSGISRSPAPSFRRCSMLTAITLIGSQDLAVKSQGLPVEELKSPSLQEDQNQVTHLASAFLSRDYHDFRYASFTLGRSEKNVDRAWSIVDSEVIRVSEAIRAALNIEVLRANGE